MFLEITTQRARYTQYIYWDSKLLAILFSFGTLDFFLAGLGRKQVYSACCSDQMAHKLV